MIKITAKKLSVFFKIDVRTVERWAEKNGGLKNSDGMIQTIAQLAEKYGTDRDS